MNTRFQSPAPWTKSFLLFLSLAMPALAATLSPAPRLTLSTNVWDFGQKWVGIPTSTEIVLRNLGNTNLTITDVITSCGCAAANPKDGGTWKGRVLAPGTSETMVIAFNTARPATNVSRTIIVMSDDPKMKRAVVTVKGEVRNPFEGRPEERLSFGRLATDARQTQEIELVNVTGQPLSLKLRPPDPDSAFEITLTEVTPGRSYKLAASTKPPLQPGASALEVQLDTGVAAFPLQNVPVTAFIPAPAFISPAKLFAEAGRPVQRLVRLSYAHNRALEIKDIRSTHPDLVKVELLPSQNAITNSAAEFQDHLLRVSLPPGSQLPATGALIEIHTNDRSPEYRKFTVPIESLRAPAGSVRATPKTTNPS